MKTLSRTYRPSLETIDLLAEAAKYDNEDITGLLIKCMSHANQWHILEVHEDALLMCALMLYVQPPKMTIWLLGGYDFDRWYDNEIQNRLDVYCRSLGCNNLRFYGRLGWLRKPLPGWTPRAVEFVREIKR